MKSLHILQVCVLASSITIMLNACKYKTKQVEEVIPSDSLIEDMGYHEPEPLTGFFQYTADVPIFRPCGDSILCKVKMDSAYLILEHAYSDANLNGAPVYVELKGYFQEDNSAEKKESKVLFVESLEVLDKKGTCLP